MTLLNNIKNWFTAMSESRFRNKFMQHTTVKNRDRYFEFLHHKNIKLPILKEPKLMAALTRSKLWEMEDYYLQKAVSPMTAYLFNNIAESTDLEWGTWIKCVQKLKHDFTEQDTAQALWNRHRAQSLAKIEQEETTLLFNQFLDKFLDFFSGLPKDFFIKQAGEPHSPMKLAPSLRVVLAGHPSETLPLLLEFFALMLPGQEQEKTRVWLKTKLFEVFNNLFIKLKDIASLKDLFWIAANFDIAIPMDNDNFRTALFTMYSWKIPSQYLERLFSDVEGHLLKNVGKSTQLEWKKWIVEAKAIEREIHVADNDCAHALSEASNAGKLDMFSKEELGFLLKFFEKHYQQVMTDIDPEKALHIVLELAALGNVTDLDDKSKKILSHWAKNRPVRPRSLVAMSDEESFKAPLSGVGSPHNISVTIYRKPGFGSPTQIVRVGTSGDSTINAKIFASLFATALVCDKEPTFVLSSAAVLSFKSDLNAKSGFMHDHLFFPVLGPNGPITGGLDIPTIGMDVHEAVSLLSDTFQRFKNQAGCVNFMDWKIEDAIRIENRVKELLQDLNGGDRIISPPPGQAKGAGVVTAIPLLHRNEEGAVVPVELEIDLRLLGQMKFHRLLTDTRHAYIEQLREDIYRREKIAENTYRHTDKGVRLWNNLTMQERIMERERRPFVLINQQVDLRLGIVIELDPPQEVDLFEYEDHIRPRLRDSSKKAMEDFAALQQKLNEINTPGSTADILTFKLLVDAVIRQEPLHFDIKELHSEYLDWVKSCSAPLWSAIEKKGKELGIPPETLAADNMLFNSRLDLNNNTFIIQPWVAIDLHDFLIMVDCKNGSMKAFPAGKKPSLEDTVVPNKQGQVKDLKTLHDAFSKWVEKNLDLGNGMTAQEKQVKSEILSDEKLKPILSLQRAKHLLFRGQIEAASEIIAQIRMFDNPAIYFWGAVIQQCFQLDLFASAFSLERFNLQEKSKNLWSISLNTVLQHIQQKETAHNPRQKQDIFGLGGMKSNLLNDEAKEYIQQMKACDFEFFTQLQQPNPKIYEMELHSFNLTAPEIDRYEAAKLAIASLELLDLAELMKSVAEKISSASTNTSHFRQQLEPIKKRIDTLSMQESQSQKEIEKFLFQFA